MFPRRGVRLQQQAVLARCLFEGAEIHRDQVTGHQFADDPLPAIPKRRSQQRKIVTVSPTPARHGVTEQLGVPRVGAGSGVLATPGGSPFSTGGVPPGPADPLQGGKGYVIGHICGHVTPPARHHM